MKIGFFNFTKQNAVENNKHGKDLTSFGSKEETKKDTELVSKDAAQALKNKYMADISFEGHRENLSIKRTAAEYHEYYTSTDGETVSDHDFWPGFTIHHKDLVKEAVTTAKMDTGREVVKEGSRNSKKAALEAIRSSKSCDIQASIKEINPVYDSEYATDEVKKVYFTDPGEVVRSGTRNQYDYVVYAPGSRDADERSFWQKLFG